MSGKPGIRGWGHIKKLPSGRYRASYVGPDVLRHPPPTTFTKKMDAEEWLAAQRRLIEQGKWLPPPKAREHRRQQSARWEAVALAPKVIDALEVPDAPKTAPYLYVLEIVGMGTKVGVATKPRRRLKTLHREANGYDYSIGRIWLSQPHAHARDNEQDLIALGGNDNRREYLAVGFVQAVERAEALTRVNGTPVVSGVH